MSFTIMNNLKYDIKASSSAAAGGQSAFTHTHSAGGLRLLSCYCLTLITLLDVQKVVSV
jgi:hypothetical protein